ncbi:hypothetical protein [Streptomyces lavendofoliae]
MTEAWIHAREADGGTIAFACHSAGIGLAAMETALDGHTTAVPGPCMS